MTQSFEDRRWPLGPDDDEWPIYALSDGGTALRHGVMYLLDGRYERVTRDALNALAASRWIEYALDLERALLIAQARLEGDSWGTIAHCLGLTKQAVHYRYREHVDRLTTLIMSREYTEDDLRDYVDTHFDAWRLEAEVEE